MVAAVVVTKLRMVLGCVRRDAMVEEGRRGGGGGGGRERRGRMINQDDASGGKGSRDLRERPDCDCAFYDCARWESLLAALVGEDY